MEITVKITTKHGTYEMTGDSSDQFDGWRIDQDDAGRDASEVADVISEAVFKHFDK